MNPCDVVRELIPWYITGRIETADAAAVDEHLAACAACRDELIAAMKVRAAARIDGPIGDSLDRAWDEIDAQISSDSTGIDIGSFLLGLHFGVAARRGTEAVHGSLRVLGRDVPILGRKRKGT
jgi:hypothetical protein